MSWADKAKYEALYKKIQSILNDRSLSFSCFDDFLMSIGAGPDLFVNRETYELAIRSSLKKADIFLKRKFYDRMLNGYNRDILLLQQANMDIQYILDPYACCTYIINYINKANRGVSKLMREAMEEIRQGNLTVKQQLRHLGNKFIRGSEISAQEAAYGVLGLHPH